MADRQEAIHAKGFSIVQRPELRDIYGNQVEYGKIKVGFQTLEDAVVDLGSLKKVDRRTYNKYSIYTALARKDYPTLRNISNYFFEISGLYERLCRYFSGLYRYDWYVTPYVIEENEKKNNKILDEFSRALDFLDESYIKKLCNEIALKVIVNGCYYGYYVETSRGFTFQELPINYCRSRFKVGTSPAVEFNPKFFDDAFPDIEMRMRVLKMYPKEFAEAYIAYKKSKLNDKMNDGSRGWWLLDPSCAFKVNLNGRDYPLLVNITPKILELDEAQDLDRRKMMQQLLKVIIQKLPLDKNGDLIFDVDEAKDIHNNTVQMLKRAVGVDVMTTFADVDVADLADSNTTTTRDELEKVERTVYNEAGVSQNLFNSNSNLALEKASAVDEASVRDLIFAFDELYNRVLRKKFPGNKKWCLHFNMLETTINNYKEMSKMYKEHTQLGFSKMLPQIALGHSQSSIIATAYFENEVLKLQEIMIPPLMSSTLNGKDILPGSKEGANAQSQVNKQQADAINGEKKTGRPEKTDEQKSDKTIANREAAGKE